MTVAFWLMFAAFVGAFTLALMVAAANRELQAKNRELRATVAHLTTGAADDGEVHVIDHPPPTRYEIIDDWLNDHPGTDPTKQRNP